MAYYTPKDGAWTQSDTAPDTPPYIQIDMDHPIVHLVGDDTTRDLSGAPARTPSETVHTVTIVPSTLNDPTTLCALRAEGNDLTVEDRRPAGARTKHGDALDHLQSAMDEIMIPLYIDDAIEELSETQAGLVLLHTAQYDDPPRGACSYFRTAAFENGTLLIESERGAL